MSYYEDYEGDYDFRTWNEKYHDDNTWQKNRGILEFDGEPFLMWCQKEGKVVQVENIEGSTVFDTYSYVICASCGAKEDRLREPTNEELEAYDENR